MNTDETPSAHSAQRTIDEILVDLSLEEKSSLTAGEDVWHLPSIERLGIGSLKMSDGPSGVRGARLGTRRSLSFACGSAAGATWDTELMERYGAALAEEAQSKSVHLLLGPTICIPRTPLGGRTFESFSEDPLLTARLAVAYVRGVQANGVGCCVKHFACNDQETERMTISADVDERSLREIHLPAFEAAVVEAGAWAVMSAYNRLNGVYCGEHRDLLTGILKTDWTFDGVVVSDWFGTHSTEAATVNGLDIEMPGPARFLGAKLGAAVRDGDIDVAVLDEHALRVLRLLERCGLLSPPPPEVELEDDNPGRRLLARELAEAATVLLQNNGALPLTSDASQTVALIGPNALRLEVGGGGSSGVTPLRSPTLRDELQQLLPEASIVYEEGCRISKGAAQLDSWLLVDGFVLEFFPNRDLEGEPLGTDHLHRGEWVTLGDPTDGVSLANFSVRASATFLPDVSGVWRVAIANTGKMKLLIDGVVVVDNLEPVRGESFYTLGSTIVESPFDFVAGQPYELALEFHSGTTPLAGFQLLAERPSATSARESAVRAAAAADVAIVVVGSNRQWETEGSDRENLRLVGDQDSLIEEIARVNDRTVVVVNAGAPVEMPWIESVAAVVLVWYPGEEGAAALARVLTGLAEPGGRLPLTMPRREQDGAANGWFPGHDGVVTYGEQTLVGYRHFDAHGIEPLFCFGHGLSYGEFEFEAPTVRVEGRTVGLSLRVTNRGSRRGTEIVQVYVGDRESSVVRATKELKAFAKVALEPGASQRVELTLDERSFAFWDTDQHDWKVEPGQFDLFVGRSSRDVRHTVTVELV
jgi:beta-glucosidase